MQWPSSGERGEHAHRLHGLLPAARVDCEQVYLPVRPQCTHCSRPSTRNPVSSNPATALPAICSRACPRKPSSLRAALAVMAATVPEETGTPSSSDSASPALLGQELPGIQVDDDRGGPRPVAHRRVHAFGCLALRANPARAFPLDELMLGHHDPHRRQIEELAARHPRDRQARQAGPAPTAAARLVPLLRSGPATPARSTYCPGMPVATARLAATLLAQRPRRWLGQPLTRRRPEEFRGSSASAAPQTQRIFSCARPSSSRRLRQLARDLRQSSLSACQLLAQRHHERSQHLSTGQRAFLSGHPRTLRATDSATARIPAPSACRLNRAQSHHRQMDLMR